MVPAQQKFAQGSKIILRFVQFKVAHAERNCYPKNMKNSFQKNIKSFLTANLEGRAMLVLLSGFAIVLALGWGYSVRLSQSISPENSVVKVDPTSLIEVEKLRNLSLSQFSNSRAFFLLGSRYLFDNQKEERQKMTDQLAAFQQKYPLAGTAEQIAKITQLLNTNQDIFDQGMKFREKQTESKIIGQFYQSKASPIFKQIDAELDALAQIHSTQMAEAQKLASAAASKAEKQIPAGMTWLSISMSLLFLAMGLLITHMIRQRKHHFAERERLYKEASRAALAREEILSCLNQDLPDSLQLIKELSLQPSSESGVQIQSLAVAIEELLKDLSDQKKSELGMMTLKVDQLSIDDLLEDAKHMLQPLAKQSDVRLDIDHVNPPVLAFYDKERILRVLWNLLGNAIKFSPRHSKVTVKVKSDLQYVYITVSDSGPGVPDKQMPQIFDNFWQAQKTASLGSGIGLAVAKTIIEAHGGSVKAENNYGAGATFTFSLPRRRPAGVNLRRPSLAKVTKVSHDMSGSIS